MGSGGSFRFRLRGNRDPLTVEDWRQRARRRVPDMVWAYIENGADDERTLQANTAAFRAWRLRQRVLAGIGEVSLETTVAGVPLRLPVLLAPTGLAGSAHWHGDLGAARAAERAGTRLVLSSASAYTIEEVAEGTARSHWFQLYPWRDRGLMAALMQRAADSGFHALFVTVDVPVYGNRLAEQRHGMGIPPVLTPARVLNAGTRPRWAYEFLRHRRTTLKNLVAEQERGTMLRSVERQAQNFKPELDWDDLAWIRSRWPGPVYVKGVLDADDAARAVDTGADGVVVSNHGGRQLDAALGTLEALPRIAERVGDRAEVLLDGGVRTGADVIIALALGARACLVGRPLMYGLAGGGMAGVESVLEILVAEMTRNLTLMGVSDVHDLDRSAILS